MYCFGSKSVLNRSSFSFRFSSQKVQHSGLRSVLTCKRSNGIPNFLRSIFNSSYHIFLINQCTYLYTNPRTVQFFKSNSSQSTEYPFTRSADSHQIETFGYQTIEITNQLSTYTISQLPNRITPKKKKYLISRNAIPNVPKIVVHLRPSAYTDGHRRKHIYHPLGDFVHTFRHSIPSSISHIYIGILYLFSHTCQFSKLELHTSPCRYWRERK